MFGLLKFYYLGIICCDMLIIRVFTYLFSCNYKCCAVVASMRDQFQCYCCFNVQSVFLSVTHVNVLIIAYSVM